VAGLELNPAGCSVPPAPSGGCSRCGGREPGCLSWLESGFEMCCERFSSLGVTEAFSASTQGAVSWTLLSDPMFGVVFLRRILRVLCC